MDFLRRTYQGLGRRNSLALGGGLLVLGIAAFFLLRGVEEEAAVVVTIPSVRTASVANLASVNEFSTVGTVRAQSEARLQTEAGGRVVAVATAIGQSVRGGQVLARIENSREQAALLQAEGSYEAALAGAQQGDSGARDAAIAVTQAEDGARQAISSAHTAVQAALSNSIDQFFSSPESSVPGVRIDGNVPLLNSERVAYQTLMPDWRTRTTNIEAGQIDRALNESEENVSRTIRLVEQLIADTDRADKNDLLLGQPVPSYTAGLLTQKSTLTASLNALRSARTSLAAARENSLRSDIGSTQGTVSLANAQVKVALGNLRAAQAAYQKTLIRTPVSGVVNALYLKAGEYVAPGQPAAIVANNANGLEIDTAITQEDALLIAVGDQVRVESVATGTVTAIGGAVDPTTGKVAVKIAVDQSESLQNGSTVSVYFKKGSASAAVEPPTIIPLSAVKMTGSDPLVFSVKEDSTLEGHPVTLGAVRGDGVIITAGVTPEMEIVTDARGLKAGTKVHVVR